MGPTSRLFHQPRFRTVQFRFMTAVQRDFHYAIRLVTRIQSLGERTGSEQLTEVAQALRIVLLREASRRWAKYAPDDERESCTG